MNTDQIQHPPAVVVVLLLGFLGALAPEIYRLYKLRARLHHMTFSGSYFVISVLYALMGGVVAVVLPAINPYAAFYAGITWPVVVSTALHRRSREASRIEFANSKEEIINEADAATQRPPPPRRTFTQLLQDHADGLF